MKTYIPFVFKVIKWLLVRSWRYYNKFRLFILPNLVKLFNGRVKLNGKFPICSQFILLSGKGSVEIGNNCSFGAKLGGFNRYGSIEIQARYENSRIVIGNNVWTNNNIFLCGAKFIEIGDNTLIGQNVTIMDHEAHGIEPENRLSPGKIGRVIIGKNVWIGNNVSILKDSIIGDNVIIATGAVVTKSFPSNIVIGGVPAKIIKTI